MTFKTKAVISTGSNHFNSLQEYLDFVQDVPAFAQADALHITYKNAGKVISANVEYNSTDSTIVLTKEWDTSMSARAYNDSAEVEAVRNFQRSSGWEIVSWEVLP